MQTDSKWILRATEEALGAAARAAMTAEQPCPVLLPKRRIETCRLANSKRQPYSGKSSIHRCNGCYADRIFQRKDRSSGLTKQGQMREKGQ
mmetsp:Transcript_4204/g.26666  ORF Transcript_4204/g.26666 Transcript_4204/m.26666 type:complete len:91 (+) Transcript_4204:3682-3954(+)